MQTIGRVSNIRGQKMKQKDAKIEKGSQRTKRLQGGFVAIQTPKRSLKERRQNKKERTFDPVYGGERRVRTDRRRAKGPLLPTIYLLLELTMILLLVYIVKQTGIPLLYYAAMGIGTLYFVASCLPRYRIVLKRQQYYLNPQNRSMKKAS